MAKTNLVIVESPAKAKTISKYLGPGYQVKASMGHVRDLPKSKLGVDTTTFEPRKRRLLSCGRLPRPASASIWPLTLTAKVRPFPGTCRLFWACPQRRPAV